MSWWGLGSAIIVWLCIGARLVWMGKRRKVGMVEIYIFLLVMVTTGVALFSAWQWIARWIGMP